jgi:hypothetical protein
LSDLCVLEHPCPACNGKGCDACDQTGLVERRALPSLRLCGGHRDRLEDDLEALPGLYEDLAEVLGSGGTPSAGGFVTGSPSNPLPINIAVAEHRNQIAHDLVSWVRFVGEARALTVPFGYALDRHGTRHAPSTPPSVTAPWLLTHVDWLAAQPDTAVECPPVMRGLVGRARALVAPSGARRIAIGPCRGVVDDQACTGTLYATVRAEDDDRPSVIYCDGACQAEIPTESWRKFGRDYQRRQSA